MTIGLLGNVFGGSKNTCGSTASTGGCGNTGYTGGCGSKGGSLLGGLLDAKKDLVGGLLSAKLGLVKGLIGGIHGGGCSSCCNK